MCRRSVSSCLAALVVCGATAAAQTPPPTRFTLLGRVQGADDSRLAGAVVELAAAEGGAGTAALRRTSSDAAGAFRFGDLGAGVMELRIRRVGFRPETLHVEVPQIDGGAVVVPLERVAEGLARFVVRASAMRSGPDPMSPLLAFERRRTAGYGHFITQDEIERRHPQRTSDLFRSIPGVTLAPNGSGVLVPSFRGFALSRRSCNPLYWLDGTPLGDVPLDLDAVPPSQVAGIEVYSGIATVPAALRSGSANAACGAIAIWTRHGVRRVRSGRSASPVDVDELVRAGTVFTADQVDQVATVAPGVRFAPAFPDSLRQVGGQVVAEFVVGADGEIEDATVGFVTTTHPALAATVRAALETVRFEPAHRGGRAVRQVVQWPVTFERLAHSGAAAPR